MEQQPGLPPSPNAPSFAGLLASFAAPLSAAASRAPAWNDEALEDDVATLSYERALRAHARYRSETPGEDALPLGAISSSIGGRDGFPGAFGSAGEIRNPTADAPTRAKIAADATQVQSSALQKNLKSTSITIRMSSAECAQLRIRAAEAGLTVSAYLRSCTFEAESLRAQVKEVMAQLRAGESREKPQVSVAVRRSWLHWPLRARPGSFSA
jgi:hypothetical protein